jgi:dodecin
VIEVQQPALFQHRAIREGDRMSENVYKIIELTGTSQTSIEDAIQHALTRASKKVRNLRWFQVVETRGDINNEGKVGHWQVTLKAGFRLED